MEGTEKKRGAWLTIWLILMLIANFFTALTYLILNKTVELAYPNVSITIWYIYGLLALANFVFVIVLFMWKKLPFFAFCGMAIISLIMNLAILGLSIFTVFGLVGPIILYFSMKSRWELFE
jgi:hypothetical protein